MMEKKDRLDSLFKEYFRHKRRSSTDELLQVCDFEMSEMSRSETMNYSLLDAQPPKKAACPSPETLGAYIELLLDAKEKASVSDHLSKCKKCKDEVNSASNAIRLYKEGTLEKAPGSISQDILKKLDDDLTDDNNPPKK